MRLISCVARIRERQRNHVDRILLAWAVTAARWPRTTSTRIAIDRWTPFRRRAVRSVGSYPKANCYGIRWWTTQRYRRRIRDPITRWTISGSWLARRSVVLTRGRTALLTPFTNIDLLTITIDRIRPVQRSAPTIQRWGAACRCIRRRSRRKLSVRIRAAQRRPMRLQYRRPPYRTVAGDRRRSCVPSKWRITLRWPARSSRSVLQVVLSPLQLLPEKELVCMIWIMRFPFKFYFIYVFVWLFFSVSFSFILFYFFLSIFFLSIFIDILFLPFFFPSLPIVRLTHIWQKTVVQYFCDEQFPLI